MRACLLSFLLFCSSLFCAKAASVYIGALVNTESRVGREKKVAIEIAARHYNSSSSSLLLSVREFSSSADPLEIYTKARDLMNWGAEAIIGAGTWPEVAILARLGSTARIPTPMPFLVRMSYPNSGEPRCLSDVVRSYNWRRVIVVYEDDNYGSISGVLPLLSDELRAGGSRIDYHIALPPWHTVSDDDAADTVRRKLKHVPPQLSKVFIVLRSSPELAVHLFKEAKLLGMMTKGHVWIVNDDITALLDSTDLSPSFISSYMQGVVGISAFVNTTTSFFRDFSSEFQQRFDQEYGTKGQQPGMHAVRAYDAVHALAHAAAGRAEDRSSVALLEGVLLGNISGLSGSISFTREGGLPEEGRGNSAFRVINVVGRSYRELGFWSERHGFFEEETEMGHGRPVVDVLRPVFWPGGTGKTPGGWGMLRIGVPNHTTFNQFVKVEYNDSSGKVKEVTGFCIDVFREILKHLSYDLNYEFIPFRGSYDDLVNRVPLQRAVDVSFTEPILSSGLAMMVPLRPNHTPWTLAKPFTADVWFLILATLTYTAGVLWYLERDSNPEFHGTWCVQLGAALWLIFSTIFFAHGKPNRSGVDIACHTSDLPDRLMFPFLNHEGRIHNYYTKTVMVVWLLVVFILTSSFTANLSSILVTEKLGAVPPGSRVGYDGDAFVLKYLKDVLGYKERNIEWIRSPEAYSEAFKSNKISAAYLETPYIRVFLSRYKDFTVSGETHRLGGFGFVFPKDSPLATDFSQVILQLAENGALNNLEKKWFSVTLSSSPTPDNKRKKESLSLDSFWALFLLTGCTSTIILLVFSAHSFLPTKARAAAVSFEPLRQSFKKVWTATAKLNEKRESLKSSEQQGSGMNSP
ncbi:glutamate receptor [Musa troglodytarum]|uniref:Glutamate receptor n=1 Tax=Musa troglodytarum TaxID=320322 RepID=A0A9E7F5P3_9LILI|nr:glutamate receptor [Musa troglodytarum]